MPDGVDGCCQMTPCEQSVSIDTTAINPALQVNDVAIYASDGESYGLIVHNILTLSR
jgi:hypothetical protein